jgi:hypothetical protein
MSSIKTWKQLLNERIGDMQITTNDDVRTAMLDHIDALTEALKVAQKDVELYIQALDVEIIHRDALQAKLSAIEAQEPVAELLEALQAYRCTETVDEEGEGLPLVDVLTTHGSDIGPGLRELEFLADHLYDYAAPVAPAQPVNELVEALEAARDVLYQVAHGNTACGKDAEVVGGLIATALANAKAAQPTIPDGNWLWCELMDWCKKRGVAPAQYDDLFQIVSRARLATQPLTKEHAQSAQGELEDLLDMYWDLAYAEGHSHGKESYGTKANETRHKIRALLQSNAERVPLSDEQINRLWNDSFIGADPTSGNQRFKFARAIEAEITKGQQ